MHHPIVYTYLFFHAVWLYHHVGYLSRCILLEFHAPSLEIPMTIYAELPALLTGTFISMGEAFISRGIQEIDSDILPTLREHIGGAIPRVLPSYGLLFWFTIEVCIATVWNAHMVDSACC